MGLDIIIPNDVRIKIVANGLSAAVVSLGLWFLFYEKAKPFSETKPVQRLVYSELSQPKPIITEKIKEISQKHNNKQQDNNKKKDFAKHKIELSNAQGSFSNIEIPSNSDLQGKSQASNTDNNPKHDNVAILPKLNNNTQSTLYNIECQKIDQKDRPKDCPSNANARIAAMNARAPKYRPDLVVGLTRAEVNARRYAGIREKCEQENGTKYMVCIPIGKKPTSVKTPYELCMEAGLGGCTRPPRADGTPDQSLNYGN